MFCMHSAPRLPIWTRRFPCSTSATSYGDINVNASIEILGLMSRSTGSLRVFSDVTNLSMGIPSSIGRMLIRGCLCGSPLAPSATPSDYFGIRALHSEGNSDDSA